MRFAVIGLGIGDVHARVIRDLPGLELVGVCDINAERAEKTGGECGAPAYTDWAAMVAETRPEAVSVCTNPATHLPLGQALAAQGIHVLCEKPMAPDVAQCLALAEACEQAGVVLMVAQKKRFAPAVGFLKEHVGGDFGRPLSLNYRYHLGQVPRDWFWQEEDGGGPMIAKSVEAMVTRMCVRRPAGRWCRSRSSPMMAPSRKEAPRRQSISPNGMSDASIAALPCPFPAGAPPTAQQLRRQFAADRPSPAARLPGKLRVRLKRSL